MSSKRTWWKEAIVYQIYPRSFKDSNGDGIGDLRGVIEKLDYVQQLGIDAVWLNPIYKSPNEDGGYDISDYYEIQSDFGTMSDFDELLKGLHDRKLKLIMDVVVNHTSDEHPWFEESKKSKDNPYRNYYFWKPSVDGGPPNNWPSFFGGSAWQLDSNTGEYYLHLFSKKQPDLNWENPKLRSEVEAIMKFWLEKGVDGLRLDVISAISKLTDFPNTDTPDFNETIRKYYANGPRLNEFIAEMRTNVWNKFNVVTVGEGPGITPHNAMNYLDESRGLNMIFHFGHMFIDQGSGGRFDPVPWSMKSFKNVFQTWDSAFGEKGWGSIFLGNHDFPRMVSRWGNDKDYWEKSAKLLCTLLMSMRGTPFIFQGDEMGMTNIELKSIEESNDIETRTGWREASAKGISAQKFLKIANYSGRDNARTPFQWDESSNAGFTTGIPWTLINSNKDRINAQSQNEDANSVLNYFRQMILFRKNHPILIYGSYTPIAVRNEHLFIYQREMISEKWLVILNFSSEQIPYPMEVPETRVVLIGNYPGENKKMIEPWEAGIYRV